MFDSDEYNGIEHIVKMFYDAGYDIEEIIYNIKNGEIPFNEEIENWCREIYQGFIDNAENIDG